MPTYQQMCDYAYLVGFTIDDFMLSGCGPAIIDLRRNLASWGL